MNLRTLAYRLYSALLIALIVTAIALQMYMLGF